MYLVDFDDSSTTGWLVVQTTMTALGLPSTITPPLTLPTTAATTGLDMSVKDHNGVVLGLLQGISSGYSLLTPTGYYVYLDPTTKTLGLGGLLWTGTGCTGTPYGYGYTGYPQYGKTAVLSENGNVYIYATVDANGYAQPTASNVNVASIEGPPCSSSVASLIAMKFTQSTWTTIGLPSTIAWPLTLPTFS